MKIITNLKYKNSSAADASLPGRLQRYPEVTEGKGERQ